jgi:LmbE family N-acetylglucosaminyl deacetylase
MRIILAVSSHLDDAVLSAGQFIGGRPDAVVATVFAGTPDTHTVLTSYDVSCGFKTAQEAMESRRQEDIEALSVLGATHRHLDFLDSQYGFKLGTAELVKQLKTLIKELDPEFVLANLGCAHPDHIAVRKAVLEATRDSTVPVWLYEDLPARVLWPESVTEALDALHKDGYSTDLGFIGTGSAALKMNALWAYRSQLLLPEFENRHCLLVPERFWEVKR